MIYFQWYEGMSVGVPLIDSDHKALIAIINELHALTEAERGGETLKYVIRELVRYTQFHFHREEKVLQACGYPNLAEHMQAHVGFIQYINDVRNSHIRNPDKLFREDILDYLKDWLKRHILIDDMAYRPFIENDPRANVAALQGGPGLDEVRESVRD
ncbi:MAG: hemerythrin family protein [Alphaproteobacteria bacterium]|jgi:hemerythrin|nr:hemerythrin family protein [Alphaproteobacteria bacterium]